MIDLKIDMPKTGHVVDAKILIRLSTLDVNLLVSIGCCAMGQGTSKPAPSSTQHVFARYIVPKVPEILFDRSMN